MKKNLMPLLGVAFVAAVLATGIFYGLLVTRLRQPDQAAQVRAVLVPARNLDRGTVLKPDDLKLADWNAKQAPADSIGAIEQAVGLTLLEPVATNMPLREAHFAPRGLAGGVSLAIPAGMRAVSIHPGESGGVVAMLRSGSRVDVQVLDSRYSGNGQIQLRRLLQNIEVLSVGGPDGGQFQNHKPVVTLLVTPHDADRLSLADAAMQLRLVLRNPSDSDTAVDSSLAPNSLFVPAPATGKVAASSNDPGAAPKAGTVLSSSIAKP